MEENKCPASSEGFEQTCIASLLQDEIKRLEWEKEVLRKLDDEHGNAWSNHLLAEAKLEGTIASLTASNKQLREQLKECQEKKSLPTKCLSNKREECTFPDGSCRMCNTNS